MTTSIAKPRDEFRTLGRNVPAGVSVLTGWADSGEPMGVVVSSFVPLSLEPRLYCFSIHRGAWTFAQIRESGALGVTILANDQPEICTRFASGGANRFDEVPWHIGVGGLPFLDNAVAELACKIIAVHDGGDHELFVVQVEEFQTVRDAEQLVLVDGKYARAELHR